MNNTGNPGNAKRSTGISVIMCQKNDRKIRKAV